MSKLIVLFGLLIVLFLVSGCIDAGERISLGSIKEINYPIKNADFYPCNVSLSIGKEYYFEECESNLQADDCVGIYSYQSLVGRVDKLVKIGYCEKGARK